MYRIPILGCVVFLACEISGGRIACFECLDRLQAVTSVAGAMEQRDPTIFLGRIVEVLQTCQCVPEGCSQDGTFGSEDAPPQFYVLFKVFAEDVLVGDLAKPGESVTAAVCAAPTSRCSPLERLSLGELVLTSREPWFSQVAAFFVSNKLATNGECAPCKGCEGLLSSALAMEKIYWPQGSPSVAVYPADIRALARYFAEHGVPTKKDFLCKKGPLEYWREATGEDVSEICANALKAYKPRPESGECKGFLHEQ